MRMQGRNPVCIGMAAAMLMGVGGSAVAQQKVTITSEEPAGGGQAKAEEPKKATGPISASEVRVSEYMTVDIIATNDDVTNILQKLAVQARRNIVPSRSISQKVNATIYGVSFYEALEGLLKPNGMVYIERDDFIYVYTNEEWAQIEQDEAPLLSKIIYLNYLRAEDAVEFAKGMLSPRGTLHFTKDLDSSGGESSSSDVGSSVDSETPVYTPETDEFSLTNAIIIRDYQENIDRIGAFIGEFDIKPQQVLIEATIIQTKLNEANAFGVDFALLTGVNFVDFFNFPVGAVPLGIKTIIDDDGNLSSPTLPSNDGFVVSTPGNAGAGKATVRAGGIIDDDIGVFIRALDQVTDVTLLGNPKLLTLNRQRAKVLVGTKVGYLNTIVVENQVLQEVSFIDTGILLDIRPFIMDDSRIRLELMPKVSEVEFREVTGLEGITQQIPDEKIQTVSTDVVLPDGYTAVIGGLFREDSVRMRSQWPVLGDIPYAGAAFRGNDDETEQFEVIFLIKATVLNDREVSERGERGDEYYEHVRVGSRFGLLPWSRERQSSRHNLEAERLVNAGEYDRALWHIRRSLELHPIQPEALQLREQLVSGPAWWPSRSFMEKAVDTEFYNRFELELDALKAEAAGDTAPPVEPVVEPQSEPADAGKPEQKDG